VNDHIRPSTHHCPRQAIRIKHIHDDRLNTERFQVGGLGRIARRPGYLMFCVPQQQS
jgi:hypothetical protein